MAAQKHKKNVGRNFWHFWMPTKPDPTNQYS